MQTSSLQNDFRRIKRKMDVLGDVRINLLLLAIDYYYLLNDSTLMARITLLLL
jgi:hypothetical protein